MRSDFQAEQEKLRQIRQRIECCDDIGHFDALIFEVERVAAAWGIMNENYQLTDNETALLTFEKYDLRGLIFQEKSRLGQ